MMEASPPPRSCFSPQPVETTVRKSRRFPIEPVETTTRSHKKKENQETLGADPEPDSTPVRSPPRRRFVPEPIETTFKSSRLQAPNALPTPDLTPIQPAPPPAEEPAPAPKPARPRFKPQLIETSKRSKRAGDARPATLPTDKTDITPGTNHIYVERRKNRTRPAPDTLAPPDLAPRESDPSEIHPLAPRRQPSMRPHPNTRHSSRQNSFQPELEIIVSDENDTDTTDDDDNDDDVPESVPSLTGSFGSSDDSLMRQQLARTRESCDDRFSGYLLALAAKAAEKQLREQALAAFPNENFHETVEHFYDREVESATSDDGSIEAVGLLPHETNMKVPTLRRQSSDWASLEMQEHQENLNRMREDEMHIKLAAEAKNPSFRDPFWSNGITDKSPFARIEDQPIDKEKEEELQRMRSAASPPMLGGDIKFRMCPSPKATKFESDQPIDIHLNRVDDGGGLWGGYCVAEEVGEYILPPVLKGPDMLRTPDKEIDDPFSTAMESMTEGSSSSSRPSSRRSNSSIQLSSGIDERLAVEMRRAKKKAALLDEFNDSFVTQVYNYLSLGYPALARQFDEELSKIAQVSIAELRMDDEKAAHGHIGLKQADCDTAKQSARWKALKVYVLEWGMQHPSMENESAAQPSAWGVRARRGSWAI
ncbi:hypothetical protein F5884DRAFT_32128 [Xylogone sp. PMI_703]|nr:hypothetical protein F5884DRAFT_32128 [Xylogone sp. PMI_703]